MQSKVNITYVNQPTAYKVTGISDLSELGPEWLYNWQVKSSLNPNETGFYEIEGIESGTEATTWTSNSCVMITFKRPTLINPFEKFEIILKVRVIKNGVLICEILKTYDIIVRANEMVFTCDGSLKVLPDTDCIFEDTEYIYQFTCKEEFDFAYFTVENGRVYDLNGNEYTVRENIRIPVVNKTAEIVVIWNKTIPTLPNYVIRAYGEKNGQYSKVVVRNEKVLPKVINANFFAKDLKPIGLNEYKLKYGSGWNDFYIQLEKLNFYSNDFYLLIEYREKKSNSPNFTQWKILTPTPFLLGSLGQNLGYFYSIPYKYFLDIYNPGGPDYTDLEFRIRIFKSLDYSYHYHLYHFSKLNFLDNSCFRETIIRVRFNFEHCPYELKFGGDIEENEDFRWEIIYCPDEDDFPFGDFEIDYHWCEETEWIEVSPCYRYCFETEWQLINFCYRYCIETDWIFTPCYKYIICYDTFWTWQVCYRLYNVTINRGYIGPSPYY